LAIELNKAGLCFMKEAPVTASYRKHLVGRYVADLVVEDQLLLELTAQSDICLAAEAQLLNYLRATGLPVGLVLNFGATRLQIRRLVNKLDADSDI